MRLRMLQQSSQTGEAEEKKMPDETEAAMDHGIQWFSVSRPQGTREPQWKLCAGIDDNGTVFAPAGITGNEQAVLLCACFDGVPAVVSKCHIYLPTTWLAKEYPDIAEVFRRITRELIGRGANDN